MMVLASHAVQLTFTGRLPSQALTAQTAEVLSAGIHLFFALSGYLIAGPFIRALVAGTPMPDMKRYAVRRVARILPAYWIALTALLFLVPHPSYSVKVLVAHYLLLKNLVPHQAAAIYFVAWTLGVEMLFYIFVPIAAVITRALFRGGRVPVAALGGIIVAAWAVSLAWSSSSVVWAQGSRWYGPVHYSLLSFLGQFAPGMLLALLLTPELSSRALRRYHALASRPALVLGLAVPAIVAGITLRIGSSGVWFQIRPAFYALASGLILIAVVHGGVFVDRMSRLLAPFGVISYGIYLWHWVVVRAVSVHHLRPGVGPGVAGWIIDTLFLSAITLPVATASWFAVERPLMRAAASWRRPRATPRPPAARPDSSPAARA